MAHVTLRAAAALLHVAVLLENLLQHQVLNFLEDVKLAIPTDLFDLRLVNMIP